MQNKRGKNANSDFGGFWDQGNCHFVILGLIKQLKRTKTWHKLASGEFNFFLKTNLKPILESPRLMKKSSIQLKWESFHSKWLKVEISGEKW